MKSLPKANGLAKPQMPRRKMQSTFSMVNCSDTILIHRHAGDIKPPSDTGRLVTGIDENERPAFLETKDDGRMVSPAEV